MSDQTKSVRKWSGGPALTKTAIQNVMRAEGLKPIIIFGAPGEIHTLNALPIRRITWVFKGSITFVLLDKGEEEITLYKGDRLDLPPDVLHYVVVGPEGVQCLEARQLIITNHNRNFTRNLDA